MSISSAHIAIVDDDPDVRCAVKILLIASSIESVAYESGEAFLASLATAVPACVVLDVMMPGMSGWEVLTQLSDRCSHVPVIIITAHDMTGHQNHESRRRLIACLRKPFDEADLLAAIARALATNSNADA